MSDTTAVEGKIDYAEVMRRLPHRYPFLLVDRVLAYEKDASLTAIKNVTVNEPFFEGHFPGQPVMPGVLILEAMAQAWRCSWPCRAKAWTTSFSCSRA